MIGRHLVPMSTLLLFACVSQPEPWSPDGSTVEDNDFAGQRADGYGAIDGAPLGTDGVTSDMRSEDALAGPDSMDLGEVFDSVSPLDAIYEVADGSCEPACGGLVCGPDGCGGSCGECEPGAGCHEGICVGLPYHLWSKGIASSVDEQVRGFVGQSDGSFFIVGHSTQDTVNMGGLPITLQGQGGMIVARFGPAGDHIWSGGFSGPGMDYASAAGGDELGNFYVTGWTDSNSINFGSGPLESSGATSKDVVVFALKGDGNLKWAKRFGGGYDETGEAISVAKDGLYLAGEASTLLSLGGPDLGLTSWGGDVFVAKLGLDGAHVWSSGFSVAGGTGKVRGLSSNNKRAVVVGLYSTKGLDFGGGPLPFGSFPGPTNAFLTSFSASGSYEWSVGFGSDKNVEARAVSLTPDGVAFVTGTFQSSSLQLAGSLLANPTPDTDQLFLARFEPDGSPTWAIALGGPKSEYTRSIYVDGPSNVYLTGQYSGSYATFGGEALADAPYTGVYLAKFGPGGGHVWSTGFPCASTSCMGYGMHVGASGQLLLVGHGKGTELSLGGDPIKYDSLGHHPFFAEFIQ